jgi:hypothetical protein
MFRFITITVIAACLHAADTQPVITDQAQAKALKQKYVALTNSWVKDIEFTPAEQAAMQAGKQWEDLMKMGPDDPLAKKIIAAGEPSFAAMLSYYPGRVLDRTVLGTYSDPHTPFGDYNDEFAIYWNGAIGANLIKGHFTDRFGGQGVQPLAHKTLVVFRVGAEADMFGRIRAGYSSIGYEQGYLPIVTASYEHAGVRYRETALAHKPFGETGGWDVAYVRFELSNVSRSPQTAALHEDIVLNDDAKANFEGGKVSSPGSMTLLACSDPNATFDPASQRLTHEFNLKPGEVKSVYLKIPYLPDAKSQLHAASEQDFQAAYTHQHDFWTTLLSKGAELDLPEPRINNVWRALLLQNFVLADGPKFTYGSGLRYNDSTYPQENGFATHVFALYGFKDYADALQPWFVGMSATREGAGRKYQNRRAMILHHLLENYRLTGKRDLFDKFKADYFRIADEIISDRHSTMTDTKGEKPLYWGLLPPDKPGADVQASTQVVYVLGHNITNCEGLQDFGRFLTTTGLDVERGKRYLSEAADFRATLMSAMQRAAIRVPGRPPFVDLQTLLFRQTPDYGPDPYDDLANGRLQGAYFHYWVDMEFHYNFFNPADEVGQWLADYVQQRNGFVLGCTRARSEIDPAHGWINSVYDGGYYNFRLRQGKISDFLLGLYSKLAFGMSQHVYVSSEGAPFIRYNTENGGYVGADYSFPNSAANADTLLMLRNALVIEELKDNIETGTLFLLRGAPRDWFQSGKRIAVRRLGTYFGDISFSIDSALSDHVIKASITPPAGDWQTLAVSFRHPSSTPIRGVRVNGSNHSDFDADGTVRLKHGPTALSVEVSY